MSKRAFKTLLGQLDLHLRSRVPLVHQTESSECGLACLAMICNHYGKIAISSPCDNNSTYLHVGQHWQE